MKNDLSRAKQLYLKCRGEYLKLSNEEKKEIYNKIEKLYTKLSSVK